MVEAMFQAPTVIVCKCLARGASSPLPKAAEGVASLRKRR